MRTPNVTAPATIVPERQDLVRRPALEKTLREAHNRPVVIAAPSGSGKTSLAVNHANSFEVVAWFDAAVYPVTAPNFLSSVVERLAIGLGLALPVTVETLLDPSVAHRLGDCIVVIDDFDVARLGSDALRDTVASLSRLSAAGMRLIVTVPGPFQGEPDRASAPFVATMIDADDLKVGVQEYATWADESGLGPVSECDARSAYLRSNGVPHVFTTLLMQGDSDVRCRRRSAQMIDEWMLLGGVERPAARIVLSICLLGTGTFADLASIGVDCPRGEARILARELPLLGIAVDAGRFSCVEMDVADLARCASCIPAVASGSAEGIADLLVSSGQAGRACEVLELFADARRRRDWLLAHSAELVDFGVLDLLLAMIGGLPDELVDERIDIVRMGVNALRAGSCQMGGGCGLDATVDDPGMRRAARTLLLCAAVDGADEKAMSGLVAMCTEEESDPEDAAEAALLAFARTLLGGGSEVLPSVADVLSAGVERRGTCFERLPLVYASLDRIFTGGETAARVLSMFSDSLMRTGSGLTSAMVDAELGFAMAMALRIDVARDLVRRAETFLREHEIRSLADTVGFYSGLCDVYERLEGAGERIEDSIRACITRGDYVRANARRIHQAIALRASGDGPAAMVAAERALEFFSGRSSVQLRCAASIEFAACLAYLGDSDAARSYLTTAVDRPALPPYLAHRYALLESLLGWSGEPRVEGEASDASRWVTEMYVRAFESSAGRAPAAMEPVPAPAVDKGCAPAEATGMTCVDGAAPLLYVRMFGGFELECDGAVFADDRWYKRKSRSLFATLVTYRGKDVSREVLFDRYWPHMDVDRARDNFYVTWSNMKRTLALFGDPNVYVKNRSGICRIDSAYIVSDLDEFEALAARIAVMDATKTPLEVLDLYRRMRTVYRGDLMAGNLYEDWFSRPRAAFRDTFLEAMTRASEVACSIGDSVQALWFARQAFECDSSREEVYSALMRAQMASNQRGSALDTFHRCREYLSDELGLDPSYETMELYNDLLMMDATLERRRHHEG